MLRNLLITLALLCAAPALALDEATVLDEMMAYVAADRDCSETQDWPGWERRVLTIPGDGYRLRYSRFGCEIGPRGVLVISPGRSEPSYEYAETAIDFIARGFGPIYVVDHRGQGLSPRLLADTLKVHVERFDQYVEDFAAFVAAVEADVAALSGGAEVPLYLTSNSMGGAIGIGYFQRVGEDNPFRAAAFISAMSHVNYISFTTAAPTWFNLRLYSESGVVWQSRWRCNIAWLWDRDLCNGYAAPDSFGPYVTGSRRFVPGDEGMMTQSRARYDLRTRMWDEVDWNPLRTAEYAGENWVGPQVGGSTTRWSYESVLYLREMRRNDSLERMVQVPVMLLSATQDLRAYRQYAGFTGKRPDLSRHTRFCNRLNAASLAAHGGYVCQMVAINGAFHEMYKERDAERTQAIETVDWFFRSHAP
jgi:lysophospholipase